MNDARADRDLQQALTAWMDGAAPTQSPSRLLENTFVETMKTDQSRRYPWHGIMLRGRLFDVAGSPARVALVVLGALLVVATAVTFVGGGIAPTPPPAASPTATPAAQSTFQLPPSNSIVAEATVPLQAPLAIVSDGTDLWVLAPGRVDRIDPTTNSVTGTVELGPATDLYNGLAANDAGLWATDSDSALLYRVDPATLSVVAPIAAGTAPKGVVATAAGVWVADVRGGAVLRVDRATNEVVATTTVGETGPGGPNWLASGLGSIWVDIPNNRTIVRIDPATDLIQATIPAPDLFTPCGGFAIDTGAVWITGCSGTMAIARIDPSTNLAVATIPLPGYAYNPTVIDGAPWISIDTGDATTGLLARINPATNLIDRVLVPGISFGGGGDILLAAGSVWVVDGYNNVVLRLPLAAFAG